MKKAKYALSELGAVLLAWLRGEGDLPGLIVAWAQVVTGQVAVE